MSHLDSTLSEYTEAFAKGGLNSTYLQKLACTTMAFDICFSSPFEKITKRIHKQILGNLSCLPSIYFLLDEAYQKISACKDMSESDPILDALYSVFCISYLEKEDFRKDDDSTPMESLFESYCASYMLVSIYSPIIEDVNLIQSHLR